MNNDVKERAEAASAVEFSPELELRRCLHALDIEAPTLSRLQCPHSGSSHIARRPKRKLVLGLIVLALRMSCGTSSNFISLYHADYGKDIRPKGPLG